MGKLTFSMGGVHPHDSKFARDRAIEVLPLPPTVYVSMAQHLGAPAKPVVAVGDKVKVGQVLGEPGGFISAFIHDGKPTSWFGYSNTTCLFQGQFRRKIRHTRCAFRLTISSYELFPLVMSILCKSLKHFGCEFTTTLRNGSQVGQIHTGETHFGQNLITIWHPGKTGCFFQHSPKTFVQQRSVREQQ